MTGPLYFASEPVAIDRHQWRVVVTDSKFGGRRFLYQFAAIGELPIWEDMASWPMFRPGTQTMGLPARLADLHAANAAEIAAAIAEPRESFAELLMQF
jgi:hypothetical protein